MHLLEAILSKIRLTLLIAGLCLVPAIVQAQQHMHGQQEREKPPVNPIFYRKALTSERTVVRSGVLKPLTDSQRRTRDSLSVATLSDSLRMLPDDSLRVTPGEIREQLPDSIRRIIFARVENLDSLRTAQHEQDSIQQLRKKGKYRDPERKRKPFLSDSMPMRKVCLASAVMPGFGQIYNKQYWKLPILYGVLGGSIALAVTQSNKYRPLKREFDAITDQSLYRTEELNSLQRRMIRHNTWRQLGIGAAIASYLYFIGDAAMCYKTNSVSNVTRATTMSTICPGAGQIVSKSYWKVPIVLGGFATTIYCIDWNNRGYQRFKKAYHLRADYDAHPELYPHGSQDEFHGRYNAQFLKNLRDSYRRNRDLCIIITAGLYLLQVVDAHVDAHLKDFDISDDLKVTVTPMIQYSQGDSPTRGGSASYGVNFSLNF